jgi:thiamine pyrophosphate-dependent acetolactate synthase large subunit-like protein
MTHTEALETLAEHRGERIVISSMGSVPIWAQLSDTPLDFPYIPSAMGEATALGTGLALAQPVRGVIVLTGDGSMLMNPGSLVTIAAQEPNLFVAIIDNGLYEVTGGQPTAGTGRVNFAGLARASGIGRIYECDAVEAWERIAPAALAGRGPVVIWLKVEGRRGEKTPSPPHPMPEQIARLQQALAIL